MPFRDISSRDRHLFFATLGSLVLGMLGCSRRLPDYSSVIVGKWEWESSTAGLRDQGFAVYARFDFHVDDTLVGEVRVIDQAILKSQSMKATYVVDGDRLTVRYPEGTTRIQLENYDGQSIFFHLGDCAGLRLQRVRPGD